MIIYIAAGLLVFILLALSYLIYVTIFRRPPKIYDEDTRMDDPYFVLGRTPELLEKTTIRLNQKLELSLQKAPSQTQPYMEDILARIEELRALPWETMTITSQDGLTLYGLLYHHKDGAPLHICFHSSHGTPFRDCCGFASFYLSLGHNLLLVESRARLRSEGACITYGVKERHDCVSWVEACQKRFGPVTPIVLSGISMGATTILMSSNHDLGPSVKGIVADCPYNSPAFIIRRFAREMSLPGIISFPCVWLSAFLFAHFTYHGKSAIHSVKKARVPILLLHGGKDNFAPFSMASKIQEANLQMVSFYPFPLAGHQMSYFSDPRHYKRILEMFLESILPELRQKETEPVKD